MDETTTDGVGTETGTDGTDCDCQCPGEDTEGGCTQSDRGCAVVGDCPPSGLGLLLLLVLVAGQVIRRSLWTAPPSILRG